MWERTILALSEQTLNPTAPVRRAKCLDGPGQGPDGSPAARGKTKIVRIGSFVYAFNLSRQRKSDTKGCRHPGAWEVPRHVFGLSFLPPHRRAIAP